MAFKSGNNNMQYKHGMSDTRIHNIWKNMKSRCHNPNDTTYFKYGAKGITVNLLWRKSFIIFYHWAIKNGYNDSLYIDRIDFNKGYFPSNCRWVTPAESSRNTSNNRFITIGNRTECMVDWAKINKINYQTVRQRIYRGWNPIDAVTIRKLK